MIPDLAHYFAPATRSKGNHYFRGGRVSLRAADASGLMATVQGTVAYTVTIVFDDPLVIGLCSCPYCLDGRPCKHIWATLLAAHEEGHLPAFRRPRFELDDAFLDDVDGAWTDEDDRTPGLAGAERYDALGLPAYPARTGAAFAPRPQPPPPRWIDHLRSARPGGDQAALRRPAEQRLLYGLDVEQSITSGGLTLQVLTCDRRANGDWGKPKATGRGIATDLDDRRILALLSGCARYTYPPYGYVPSAYTPALGEGRPFAAGAWYTVPSVALETLLPLLCGTGRFHRAVGGKDLGPPLAWDDGPPWELQLEALPGADAGALRVSGFLRRGEVRRPIAEPALLLGGGAVVDADRIARLTDFGRFDWIAALRRHGSLTVPVAEVDELLGETLVQSPDLALSLPADLQWTIDEGVAVPRLSVRSPAPAEYPHDKLRATVSFDYDGATVAAHDGRRGVPDRERRRLVLRDVAAEERALASLAAAGVRRSPYAQQAEPHYDVVPSKLPAITRTLVSDGWRVEAHGRRIRTSTRVDVRVTSGIDWFDVEGGVAFGDETVPLPEVMRALARGLDAVQLGDGTSGLLPEEWLRRHGLALSFGEAEGSALRFRRSQLTLLDDLLDPLPPADVDEVVSRARAELRAFDGIEPGDAAASFTGTLRPYQRDGLGWLGFLERFGFGGCLADDMGLGKTIQVLAHLDARRATGVASGPSLVVAPRSVIFNWMSEAERFVPDLRVLDHSGTARDDARIGSHDVVLTTYGTLRRDAARLKDVEFDYVVLDEAHMIKNSASESAKAARLLRARHRIALSGTPVQNHLGELWSLFAFLNPGMLDGARAHGRRVEGVQRRLRPSRRAAASRAALHPPPDQGGGCPRPSGPRRADPLLRSRRRPADALRSAATALPGLGAGSHRTPGPGEVADARPRGPAATASGGVPRRAGRSRERQRRLGQDRRPAAARLEEVVEDGHKALVFSQFTSLLALVRRELDIRGIAYAYLDGRTSDRESKVDTFQQRADLPVFLISLKAGGLGLNLTAADYVFLLDPWWNPAVEAQAIDRAHRIGQTRPVLAYRLIARDTVEEKHPRSAGAQARPRRRDHLGRRRPAPPTDGRRPGVAAAVACHHAS